MFFLHSHVIEGADAQTPANDVNNGDVDEICKLPFVFWILTIKWVCLAGSNFEKSL